MTARAPDSNGDAGRIDHLVMLAGAVLAQVGVPFTRGVLRAAVEREYALTLRGGTVFAQASRRLVAVDRGEPTNGLIILCRVLRRYHVRHVVGETPGALTGVHVVARAKSDGADWRDTLVLQAEAPCPGPAITAFVLFYANELSGEYDAGDSDPRGRSLRLLRLVGAGVAAVTSAMVVLAVASPAFELAGAGVFALAGLALSGCLVAYELHPRVSAWTRPGCEHGRLRLSCAAVMQSRAAKLGGVISLADLGVVYFGAQVVWLMTAALFDRGPDVVGTLCWLAWVPLPLSVFALGYQWLAVRAWCSFCLAVHAVLWAQAIWAFQEWSGATTTPIHAASAAVWTGAAGAIGLMLFLLRRGARVAQRRRVQELQHAHWTRDGELFRRIFRAPAVCVPAPPGAPVIGDVRAQVKLVAVLSPRCAPCAGMLKNILRLVDWFNGTLAVSVILTDGPLQDAVLRLTAAQRNAEAVALLKTWYLEPRLAEGALAAVVVDVGDAGLLGRRAHADWLRSHRIVATPTLIFNGRMVPDDYYDLTLLGEMIEEHWSAPESAAPSPAAACAVSA